MKFNPKIGMYAMFAMMMAAGKHLYLPPDSRPDGMLNYARGIKRRKKKRKKK